MRKKSKGLHLFKETVRNLDRIALGEVEGGRSLACTTSLIDSIGCTPFATYGASGCGGGGGSTIEY